MSCIAETAFSMGFIIFQACKERIILPNARLMQHQMTFGIKDEKSKVENYIHFINQMENEIVDLQINRINITREIFKENISHDWWIYGKQNIIQNCADKISHIECSKDLTKKTETIEKGIYKYTYSKCPLITKYIKKEKLADIDFDNIFF